jgi:hypothetical protein
VTVKVFDALGRKVVTLVSERQGEGVYDIEFNGEGCASGVYYYELTTTGTSGRITQVRKMLLVK